MQSCTPNQRNLTINFKICLPIYLFIFGICFFVFVFEVVNVLLLFDSILRRKKRLVNTKIRPYPEQFLGTLIKLGYARNETERMSQINIRSQKLKGSSLAVGRQLGRVSGRYRVGLGWVRLPLLSKHCFPLSLRKRSL